MRFSIQRETLLEPLQLIIGVVERRQTKPILSNILVKISDDTLWLTSTDCEIEIIGNTQLDIDVIEQGNTTVPARKFSDICRALPNEAIIDFNFDAENQKVSIRSGKSRFTLKTLPTDEFPNIENIDPKHTFSVQQSQLKTHIDQTHFSMAQQDVRYYLNGLLLEVDKNTLKTVATDGHRLAYYESQITQTIDEKIQIIIPRKGVVELSKLIEDSENSVNIELSDNHIRITFPNAVFTSKLIDGRFPEYNKVIPETSDRKLVADVDLLKHSLSRASILSNEKYRGILLNISDGLLQAQAHNPEMETAEEEIEVDYTGNAFEVGFNVTYVLDALAAIKTSNVILHFGTNNNSCLITPFDEEQICKYVVMPMRL